MLALPGATEPIVIHQRAHNTAILVLIVMSRIGLQALHGGEYCKSFKLHHGSQAN
eukprot:COSAG01_NODE_1021_length_12074_cov_7.519876_7_plen_55_part_00